MIAGLAYLEHCTSIAVLIQWVLREILLCTMQCAKTAVAANNCSHTSTHSSHNNCSHDHATIIAAILVHIQAPQQSPSASACCQSSFSCWPLRLVQLVDLLLWVLF